VILWPLAVLMVLFAVGARYALIEQSAQPPAASGIQQTAEVAGLIQYCADVTHGLTQGAAHPGISTIDAPVYRWTFNYASVPGSVQCWVEGNSGLTQAQIIDGADGSIFVGTANANKWQSIYSGINQIQLIQNVPNGTLVVMRTY